MLPALALCALSVQAFNVAAEQAQKLPVYSDYRVAQIYRGKPARRVFKTKEELEFRTRIRQGTASGPNFAGHYAVIQWGAGTGTGHFVIVDVKTGEIFFHADPNRGIGFLFNQNSRLMVIDGCEPLGEPCVRSFWEWTGREMKFLRKIGPAPSFGSPEAWIDPTVRRFRIKAPKLTWGCLMPGDQASHPALAG